MARRKTIYCPKCGKEVGIWDGITTMNLAFQCRKCRKRIIYHADNGAVAVREIPQRNTASGMSFC